MRNKASATRPSFKAILSCGAFLVALMLGLMTAVPAHAAPATQTTKAPSRAVSNLIKLPLECRNVSVVLHGNQPPTVSCASDSAPTSKNVSKPQSGVILPPAIGQDSGCGTKSLWLYSDANFGGDRICFIGAGQVDLGNLGDCKWWGCIAWSALVSSYWSGCSGGKLLKPGQTEWITFGSYSSDNYVGDIFNDQIRYVNLFSNC